MGALIPLTLLLFPALELWVLIQVGKEIGALATVALVFLSAVVGLFLLRLRGLHVAKSLQADLAAGRLPANPLIDAFCLTAAGCLFIFPGFVSDALAILLIIPGFRHLLLAVFTAGMKKRGFSSRTVQYNASSKADGSGVTWTCTSYDSSANPPQGSFAGRNDDGLTIDCEPEDANDAPASGKKGGAANADDPNKKS